LTDSSPDLFLVRRKRRGLLGGLCESPSACGGHSHDVGQSHEADAAIRNQTTAYMYVTSFHLSSVGAEEEQV